MKAILVIDLSDNLKNHLDKVKVDVIGTLNGQELFHRLNQSLKPMPEKNMWDITKNGHVTEYAEGYNACLDEIMEE